MRYGFGECVLDWDRRALRHLGSLVHLRAQSLDVLHYLVTHPGRLLERQELLSALWPGRFVSNESLSACIVEARQSIGDSATAARFIRTIRGRGYLFDTEVWVLQPEEPAPQEESIREAVIEASPAVSPVAPVESVPSRPARSASGRGVVERKVATLMLAAVSAAGDKDGARFDAELHYSRHQMLASACGEILRDLQGRILEIRPQAVLIAFGTPQAIEHHGELSVLAATRIRELWTRTSGAQPSSLPAGLIGTTLKLAIHSDEVLVGPLDDGQRWSVTSVSDTDERLRALLAACGDNEIVMSSRAVMGAQKVLSLVLETVSSTSAIEVCRLVEASPRAGGHLHHREEPQRRFVGRQHEIAQILDLFSRVKTGQGQVVNVIGDPGMGKTRLLEELLKRLDDGQADVIWSQCLSFDGSPAYYLVADVARSLLGATYKTPVPQALAAAERHLLEAGIAEPSAALPLLQLLGYTATALSPGPDGPQRWRESIFSAVRALLQHRSRCAPVVLAVENLHWIDPTSAEWLNSCVSRLALSRVLMVTTTRPGPPLPWIGRAHVSQISLPPLDDLESRELANEHLGDVKLGEETFQALLGKAGGNPLFIEELARVHRESVASPQAIIVPEGVREVLSARIDHLGSAAKEVLRAAAVLGCDAPAGWVRNLAPMGDSPWAIALEELDAAGILHELHGSDEPLLRFHHAIGREVVYGSMLKSDRQRLHHLAADTLRELLPEEATGQIERLADHCEKSGLAEESVRLWLRAGLRSWEYGAVSEAATHLKRGLGAIDDMPAGRTKAALERDLRIALAGALRIVDRPASESAWHPLGDGPARSAEPGSLGAFPADAYEKILSGSYEEARQPLTDLIQKALHSQNVTLAIAAHSGLVAVNTFTGRFTEAIQHFERVLELCDQRDNPGQDLAFGFDPRVAGRGLHALSLWHLGRLDQVAEACRRGLAFADDLPSRYSRAHLRLEVSIPLMAQRDSQQVRRLCEECAQDGPQEMVMVLANTHVMGGWARVQQGEAEAGLELMRQGLRELEELHVDLLKSFNLGAITEGYLAAGRFTEGLETVEDGMTIVRQRSERFWEPELWRLRGELLRLHSPADRSAPEEAFFRAHESARAIASRSLELRAAMSLARFWAEGGEGSRGRDLVASALGGIIGGEETADVREARAILGTARK